jgi:hypothetical protein
MWCVSGILGGETTRNKPVPVWFDAVEDRGHMVDEMKRAIKHEVLAASREFVKHDLMAKMVSMAIGIKSMVAWALTNQSLLGR